MYLRYRHTGPLEYLPYHLTFRSLASRSNLILGAVALNSKRKVLIVSYNNTSATPNYSMYSTPNCKGSMYLRYDHLCAASKSRSCSSLLCSDQYSSVEIATN